MTQWFDIDRKGLGKLVEGRGKIGLLHELISNAWDADGVTRVEIEFEPVDGQPKVWVRVVDDAPDGFADLAHAWTLFAESSRKHNVQKRGRFNLGEKLVIAMCDEASISSTKGGVIFDHRGRTTLRTKRASGSEFLGLARITRAELDEMRAQLLRIIPPDGITTIIDGTELAAPRGGRSISAILPTIVADDGGIMRRTSRRCMVDVLEAGGAGWIYELGIPVVETGDRWSVNVHQKVPLNMDRDNVNPAYLRELRTLIVNEMHANLSASDANSTLVNDALSDKDASAEAVNRALDLKYGDKRAIFDPTDREANMKVISEGYTLIHGAQLTKDQWANVKKHEAAKPSGQIAPTKVATFSPDGEDRTIPYEKQSAAIRRVVAYSRQLGHLLFYGMLGELDDGHIDVSVISDITASWAACFGGNGLVFNLGRLGHDWFERAMVWRVDHWQATTELHRLLIHEFGHGMPGGKNHLAEEYHDGLCRLGAKLASIALEEPHRLFLRDLEVH